jgi:aminotransferase
MKNFIDKVRLPNGQIEKLDRLEKVYLIAKDLQKNSPVQFAIFGKPSAPVYQPIIDAEIRYWQSLDKSSPIVYGELQGEENYRERMAAALSRQYGVSVSKDDVIFTSGGRIAIQAASYLIRSLCAGKLVVTTNLFYPDHTGASYSSDDLHHLLLVDVETNMSALTAENLMQTIDGIDKDRIGAFIFCDPNNPMGNVVGKTEWLKIIPILEQYEDSVIVLDEAYAEMVFDNLHESLFSLASDKLRDRIILMRSGTKGFSASGERMAILVSSNKQFSNKIVEYHAANLVHSPKSAQYAYTCAMEQFNEADQLNLAAYYKPMVRNVEALLQETGFAVKSANYVKRQATFYVIADFSVLYGKEMPAKLLEYYVSSTKKSVENNIDLAMYILFKYKLALMPMHFFGAKLNSGLLRITCSFESADEFTALANTIRQINADINGVRVVETC